MVKRSPAYHGDPSIVWCLWSTPYIAIDAPFIRAAGRVTFGRRCPRMQEHDARPPPSIRRHASYRNRQPTTYVCARPARHQGAATAPAARRLARQSGGETHLARRLATLLPGLARSSPACHSGSRLSCRLSKSCRADNSSRTRQTVSYRTTTRTRSCTKTNLGIGVYCEATVVVDYAMRVHMTAEDLDLISPLVRRRRRQT